MVAIAKALDTTVEYLATGKSEHRMDRVALHVYIDELPELDAELLKRLLIDGPWDRGN